MLPAAEPLKITTTPQETSHLVGKVWGAVLECWPQSVWEPAQARAVSGCQHQLLGGGPRATRGLSVEGGGVQIRSKSGPFQVPGGGGPFQVKIRSKSGQNQVPTRFGPDLDPIWTRFGFERGPDLDPIWTRFGSDLDPPQKTANFVRRGLGSQKGPEDVCSGRHPNQKAFGGEGVQHGCGS